MNKALQEVKNIYRGRATLIKQDGEVWNAGIASWVKQGHYKKDLEAGKVVKAVVEFPKNHAPVIVDFRCEGFEQKAKKVIFEESSLEEQKQEYEDLCGEY
ncbi:MAG: hypothetical protein K8E24_013600 [Methanobacterium paludis]|nr:hypothetical protein [Methanobacterium paludis]